MTKSIDQLRRDAKALRKSFETGELRARQRVANALPKVREPLKHADFLHVIARENSFESWPKLVWADETIGLDRAGLQQRLKNALFHGQNWVAERLLADTPDLADDHFGLACALYDRTAVEAGLAEDPGAATRAFGSRRPILHLAFSKWCHARPDLDADMLKIAELLVSHGADVNDGMPAHPGSGHTLSALYGAIGHANNMPLGRWLLEQGADPNDGESLYHATELGHHEGLRMLLDHGANPRGTNALLRAMDFDDISAVQLLLEAGAAADDVPGVDLNGERPRVIPALHHAARRMSSPEMIALLLDAGADPAYEYDGMTAYSYARVFGNVALSKALEKRGHATPLSPVEAHLARLADGIQADGVYIDPETLPEACRLIIRTILHLPGKLSHVQRLVAAGVEYDRPDAEGLTPVQVAGWEGLPDMLAYLLSLKPDLSHVNGYGGTLLSTIIHGSENNPNRAGRDYEACLRLVLEEGVALPRRAIDLAGAPEVSAFLADWAEAHPGQVTEADGA